MTLDQVSVMKVCIQIGIELEKSNNNTLFIKENYIVRREFLMSNVSF